MKRYINTDFFFTVFVCFAIYIFTVQARLNIDPDFGWHLKLGELVLKQGLHASDPFSYTMPSYPFIDHEWFTNIVFYFLHTGLGGVLSSILFAIIAILAYLVPFNGPLKSLTRVGKQIRIIIFVLAIGLLQPYFGLRPQVMSWLMYSLFLKFLFWEKFEKHSFLMPLILVVWVNMHGSFPLPIVTLLLVSVIRLVRTRKIWWIGFGPSLLAIIATGLNPYGYRIWYEVYQQVTDTAVRGVLIEWKPSYYSFNIFYLIFAALYFVAIKKYFTTFKLELFALNTFLFLQGLASVRHIPLWLLVNLPMIEKIVVDFYENVKKIKFGEVRFRKMLTGTFIAVVILYTVNLVAYFYPKNRGLNEANFYPKDAIEFLKNNPYPGQVFSDYGWGGYLVWKYPEKKVFIDGRMATWKWSADIPDESNYIMDDYISFIAGKSDVTQNFEKYNVDTVLWPNYPVVSASYAFEMHFRNKILKEEPKKVFDAHQYFKNIGWNVVYKDTVSTVYRK